MCFAYSTNFNKTTLTSQLKLQDLPDFKQEPAVKAFNQPQVPVIFGQNQLRVEIMRWGLVPHWVGSAIQAKEMVQNTYNARSETLDSKPSFKDAYINARCVIPAAGFFEWKHINSKRYPYYIYPAAQDIFYFAGLYSIYAGTATFTIITTNANSLMKEIHNAKQRQPAILTLNQVQHWLSCNMGKDQLPIIDSEAMKAHLVSPEISTASSFYSSASQEPFIYPELSQLNLF